MKEHIKEQLAKLSVDRYNAMLKYVAAQETLEVARKQITSIDAVTEALTATLKADDAAE